MLVEHAKLIQRGMCHHLWGKWSTQNLTFNGSYARHKVHTTLSLDNTNNASFCNNVDKRQRALLFPQSWVYFFKDHAEYMKCMLLYTHTEISSLNACSNEKLVGYKKVGMLLGGVHGACRILPQWNTFGNSNIRFAFGKKHVYSGRPT